MGIREILGRFTRTRPKGERRASEAEELRRRDRERKEDAVDKMYEQVPPSAQAGKNFPPF